MSSSGILYGEYLYDNTRLFVSRMTTPSESLKNNHSNGTKLLKIHAGFNEPRTNYSEQKIKQSSKFSIFFL